MFVIRQASDFIFGLAAGRESRGRQPAACRPAASCQATRPGLVVGALAKRRERGSRYVA